MMKLYKPSAFAVAALVLLQFLPACSRNGASEQAAPSGGDTGAEVVTVPVEPILEPGMEEGMITYLTGEVRLEAASGGREPAIGDVVVPGDRLITGSDGYVEVQLGSLGAIRIQSDTEYRLDTVSLTDEHARASGTLSLGTVIARIRHLGGADAFEVNVPGAVCAVRGTQFMVQAPADGDAVVAVSEGTVALETPSLSRIGVDDEVSTRLDDIRALMPTVTADQTMVIPVRVLESAEEEISDWVDRNADDIEAAAETAVVALSERLRTDLAESADPEPIEDAQAAVLEEQLPEMLPAAVESAAAETETPAAPRRPTLASLTVHTDPFDAEIIINGKPAGRGRASRIFAAGRSVSVVAVSSDGRRQQRDIVLDQGAVMDIVFEPVEEPAPAEEAVPVEDTAADSGPVTVTPVSVETVQPEFQATDSGGAAEEAFVSGEASADRVPGEAAGSMAVEAAAPARPVSPAGPSSEEPAAPASDGGDRIFRFSVTPRDARIYADDVFIGTGSVAFSLASGRDVSIRIERPGYSPMTRRLDAASTASRISVELSPRPIVASHRLSAGPAIGTPVSLGNRVVGLTAGGNAFAVSEDGSVLWERSVIRSGGRALSLDADAASAYLTAGGRMKILNLNDGRVRSEEGLPDTNRPDVERHPLLAEGLLIASADRELVFFDPGSGDELDSMEIPARTLMSPAAWGDKVLIPDLRGTLLIVNPKYRIVSRTVDTGVGEPSGHAPAVSGKFGIASFGGSGGTVCGIDLASARVLWERAMDGASGAVLSHDPIIFHDVVYYYTGNRVHALDLGNGSPRFAPISGVTAPPAVHQGVLYLCMEDDTLAMHNPLDGRRVNSLDLGFHGTARPAPLGDYVVVAGEGMMSIVDPRSLRR